MRPHKSAAPLGTVLLLTGVLTGCGSTTGATVGSGLHSKGPVSVWAGPLPAEITFTEHTAAAWNREHPGQRVTVKALPSSRSTEEVVTAAITAGNTPCLVNNTSPTAVPDFARMGGLVPLNRFPGAEAYLRERSGRQVSQYRAEDGNYYQLPWKQNPAMLYYNKKIFKRAGIDPDDPGLATWRGFLKAARKVVSSGATKAAIWAVPTSEWYNAWFDFYAFFTAETADPLLKGDKPRFTSDEGVAVARLWRTLYREKLAPNEVYPGSDAFADGKTAMALWGNDLAPSYEGKVDYGVVPVPTRQGSEEGRTASFSNAKSWALYSSCVHKETAWEFMKYATSPRSDGHLLAQTGQLPVRTHLLRTYAEFFRKNPKLVPFARQTRHVVEVPQVRRGVDVWTAFRKAWGDSVVFPNQPIPTAFGEAADRTRTLLAP